MRVLVTATILIAALPGCAKKAPEVSGQAAPSSAATAPAQPMLAAAHQAPEPSTGAAPANAAPHQSVAGTVLETMDSGGYTYMKLKTAQGEVWAAVNQSPVKKGDTVALANAVPMDGFESKTLNRKFDRILFASLAPAGASAAPAAKEPSKEQLAAVAAPHAGVAKSAADVGEIKVPKAEGPDGKLIAELYAQRAALKDKNVAVRGKVVKYNGGIMGRNWMHLRDGSGSEAGKNDDITVTTLGKAAVGDVVLVKGTVHLDKDFGAGYAYPVIIEDAQVSK